MDSSFIKKNLIFILAIIVAVYGYYAREKLSYDMKISGSTFKISYGLIISAISLAVACWFEWSLYKSLLSTIIFSLAIGGYCFSTDRLTFNVYHVNSIKIPFNFGIVLGLIFIGFGVFCIYYTSKQKSDVKDLLYHISNKKSKEVSSTAPPASSESPQISTASPPVSSESPQISTASPPVSIESPQISTASPPVSP